MKDTKEHIIIVAAKLFLQKNFEEVTTRDIVSATGLSKGAFYHYFDSKEALFKEVLSYVSENVLKYNYDKYNQDSFYEFYHDYAAETIRNTDKFFKILDVNFKTTKLFINFFSLYFDALRLFPEIKGLIIGQLNNEIAVWEKAVKRARESGEIKSVMSDNQIARLFIHVNDGASLQSLLQRGSMKKAVQSFVELWDRVYEILRG